MPEYDNTNRGVLFVNDRKEKDTHPDRKGTINIEGREFWLSGWIKENDRGKFLSLSVTPKDEGGNRQQGQQPGQRPAPYTGKPDVDTGDDDDIPF